MELRLADDENTQNKLHLSETNGNPGQNVKEERNPWDFDDIKEPVVIASRPVVTNNTHMAAKSQNNMVLTVGMVLVYISFAIYIICMACVCIKEPSDMYVNLLKVQWVFSLCVLIWIVDAVLVNILYDRKISLILFAWLFPFLYPSKRNDHVNGHAGLGNLFCVVMVIVGFVCFGQIFKNALHYGGIIQITDDTVRQTAAAVMDQTTEDGKCIGDQIMDDVHIETALVKEQNGKTVLALVGYGSVRLEEDTFVDTGNKSIKTALAFIKGTNGKYELAAVALDDSTLSEYGSKAYWNAVIAD